MADPNVRIIVSATDRASAVLQDVSGETSKLGKVTNNVIGTYTELSSMLGLAQHGLQTVKQIYADTVGVTIDYARQIDDVARATGMSAEESSRWIQIADDVQLEYGELKTAMRFALQQGIDPSIEGMKKLSEQYLAIQDPIARSQFLIDNFGRSGLSMGRLLERGAEGIDKLNDGVNSWLIMSDEAVNATIEYQESVDNLNDSYTGLKVKIGTAVIPVLNDYIDVINTILNTQTSWQEKTVDIIKVLGDLEGTGGTVTTILSGLIQEIEQGTLTQEHANWVYSTFGGILAMEVLPQQEEVTTATQDMTSATWGSSAALEYQLTIQGNAIQTAQEHAQRIEEVAAAENAMKAATDSLDESLQKFGERLGTDIASKLEAALGDTEQYEAALAAIDETLGTALGPADAMEDAVEDLTTQFANGEIDLDTFKARLTEIKNEFAPFDEAVKKSMQALTELGIKYQDVLDLPDRIDLWVYTHWVDVGNPPSGTGGGAGNGGGNGGGQEPQLQRGGIGNVSLSLTFNGMQGGVTQTTIDQIGQSIREALTSGIAHAGSY